MRMPQATSAYCEDFNASPNPHFPARTNVANFEFRTLAAYLAGLARSTSAANADEFFRDYLRVKSRYHAQDGTVPCGPRSRIDRASGGASGHRGARRACGDSARPPPSPSRLAALLHDASEPVRHLERALIAFRQSVFERRREEAQRLRAAAFDRARPRRHRHGSAPARLPRRHDRDVRSRLAEPAQHRAPRASTSCRS